MTLHHIRPNVSNGSLMLAVMLIGLEYSISLILRRNRTCGSPDVTCWKPGYRRFLEPRFDLVEDSPVPERYRM